MKARFLSAFLFALCLIVGAYFALWYYAMQQAEAGLEQALTQNLGEGVSFSHISWRHDLLRAHLVVHDFQWVLRDAQTSAALTLETDMVHVSGDLLSPFKMVLQIPSESRIRLQEGAMLKTYTLFSEGMEIAHYSLSEGNELVVSTKSFTLKDGADTRAAGGVSHLLRRPSGATAQWSLSGTHLDVPFTLYGQPVTSLALSFKMSKRQKAPVISFLTAAVVGEKREAENRLVEWLGSLSEQNVSIDISDFRLEAKENWLTLYGLLQVRPDLVPTGSLRVASKQADDLFGLLIKRGIVPSKTAYERYGVRRRLVMQDGSASMTITTAAPTVFALNGLNIGVARSVPQILNMREILP